MAGERLVVQLPISGSTDFDELLEIENALTLAFLEDRTAIVDGHALKGEVFSVFIVSRADPGAIVDRVKVTLAERGVLDEALIARQGSAVEAWSVVWPAGSAGQPVPGPSLP